MTSLKLTLQRLGILKGKKKLRKSQEPRARKHKSNLILFYQFYFHCRLPERTFTPLKIGIEINIIATV